MPQHTTALDANPFHSTELHSTTQPSTPQHTWKGNPIMLSDITARCTIESISPLCQSRFHDEPKLEGEDPNSYDLRTWRKHMHIHNGTVHIPATAVRLALVEAAKYSKRQIPNQGRATWTAKFSSAIAMLEDIDLGIDPAEVGYVPVMCNANGKPGPGTRVLRRFPIIPNWKATFDVNILDPIIIEDVFTEMLDQAGMFIGIGQNRPANRGVHGRFRTVAVEWIGTAQIDTRSLRVA